MKILKLTSFAIVTMLTLAACSKEEVATTKGQVDIRTSIVSTPEVESRATMNPDGSGTFDDDDVLKLMIYGGNPFPLNIEYSKNKPLTWETIKTHAGEGDTYTFCGWYNTDPNALSLYVSDGYPAFNAATATDPDLLLATPATVAEGATVNLPFHHAMHRLIINLTGDLVNLGVTSEQFNASKVSLLNMNAAAAVDVKTGTVTPGEATDADGDYGSKTDLYDFIIAPQKVATGEDWIKIEIADMTFIYPMPATLKDGTLLTQLESGKRLTLTLTLKKSPMGETDVELSGSDISGWSSKDDINAELDADKVYTLAALQAAIANASTDPANPTRITLGRDIAVTSPIDMQDANATARYIEIDGDGKQLVESGNTDPIFRIYENQSLTLKNISLPGNERSCIYLEKGAVILESGTRVELASSGNTADKAAVSVSEGFVTIKEGAKVICLRDACYAVFLSYSGAKLLLEGGVVQGNIGLSAPCVTVAKALPNDFNSNLVINFAVNGLQLIEGTAGYTLTAFERDRFSIALATSPDGVDVTAESSLYLDAASNSVKLQVGKDAPAEPGDIDMNGKSVGDVEAYIRVALSKGITELKLIGPIANSGMGGTTGGTFYQNKQLTKIDLTEATGWAAVECDGDLQTTETVAGLPAWAFAYCSNLTEVKLPDGVKAIGMNAFVNCGKLNTINLESVTHVGKLAFNGCTALPTVSLDEAIAFYPSAFENSGLTSVTLPKATAISVGSSTGSFSNCEALISFDAPLLKNIGKNSFMSCPKLETVKVPKAETIGDYAFNQCVALKNVELESATTIGGNAFNACLALTTISLPKATTIGNTAFGGCSEVTKIQLPAATKLGDGIVNGCGKLTSLELSAAGTITDLSGQNTIGSAPFDDTNSPIPFNPAACDLVLNTDKKQGGLGYPQVLNAYPYQWCGKAWRTITY